MPICIECSYPVSHLYTSYSKADDHSLGKGVRLTQCPRCKKFADKYVEHDFVVLFIDLVLIKPQVYRHLLFNRLGRDDNKFDRSIIRLGVLLLLFDVYLTWARIEKNSSLSSTRLSNAPIVVQYLFFLTLNALATLVHHLTVRGLVSVIARRQSSPSAGVGISETSTVNPTSPPTIASINQSMSPSKQPVRLPSSSETTATSSAVAARPPPPVANNGGVIPPLRRSSTAPTQAVQPLPPPSPASPSAISTALLVSSCAKLFPILLVIWGPEGSAEVPDTGSDETNSAAATLLQRGIEALSSPTSASSLSSSLNPQSLSAATATSASQSATSIPTAASLLPSFSLSLSTATGSGAPAFSDRVVSTFNFLLSLLSLSAADTYLVLLNNIEALFILLDCGYPRAVALAVAGQAARWTVEKALLTVVGVG
ncbi:hypothetical protein Plec18167_001125 [Paecilomyces lecythidis]|uniref:Protein ARV n=1 Tax=Paecilomyces lecythidis TaxID=3004212 RepID=A0ABR3YCB9_9EURO